MGDDDIDGWPPRMMRMATVAHLHALGQISLAYNYLEESCGFLFKSLMPTERSFSEELFHKLNNRDRVDLLSAIISQNEKEETVKDAVLHFLLCYNICTDNRNILAHARQEKADADILALSKKASNNPSREIHFQIPLSDLRLVADQIGETFGFGMELAFWLSRRRNPLTENMRGLMIEPFRSQPWPGPLPNRPPKPRKLTPYQPLATPPIAQPPPQPSGE